VTGKISHTRKNIRKIENENVKLLRRITAISPTYNNSKMRMDREKQVKLLKLKGKYPYVEWNIEGVPTPLNHSGSQSVSGQFNNVSSRTHINGSSAAFYSSPETHHPSSNVFPGADFNRREYIERYDNYLRE